MVVCVCVSMEWEQKYRVYGSRRATNSTNNTNNNDGKPEKRQHDSIIVDNKSRINIILYLFNFSEYIRKKILSHIFNMLRPIWVQWQSRRAISYFDFYTYGLNLFGCVCVCGRHPFAVKHWIDATARRHPVYSPYPNIHTKCFHKSQSTFFLAPYAHNNIHQHFCHIIRQ